MFKRITKEFDIVVVVNSNIKYDSRVRRLCKVIQTNNLRGLVICSKSEEKYVHGLPIISLNLDKKGVKSFLKFTIRSFLLLLNMKFRVVISCDLDTLPSARFVSFIKRKTLIFDAHEYVTGTEEARRSPWRHLTWELIEQIFVRLSPLGITVNTSLANIFKDKYHVHYITIRNVPFLGKFNPPSLCYYPPTIIYAGTLSGDRRLDELIRAVATLNIPLQILISGSGPSRTELKEIAQELGISDRVKFLGMVEPSRLRLIISRSWLGVNLLSHTNINFYFSLANKFFDYVHAGIPQITMDFPEYRKLNSEFPVAILLKRGNVSHISAAIEKIYADKQTYLRLKQNTCRAREKWNFQKESKKLEIILKNVLNL